MGNYFILTNHLAKDLSLVTSPGSKPMDIQDLATKMLMLVICRTPDERQIEDSSAFPCVCLLDDQLA